MKLTKSARRRAGMVNGDGGQVTVKELEVGWRGSQKVVRRGVGTEGTTTPPPPPQ